MKMRQLEFTAVDGDVTLRLYVAPERNDSQAAAMAGAEQAAKGAPLASLVRASDTILVGVVIEKFSKVLPPFLPIDTPQPDGSARVLAEVFPTLRVRLTFLWFKLVDADGIVPSPVGDEFTAQSKRIKFPGDGIADAMFIGSTVFEATGTAQKEVSIQKTVLQYCVVDSELLFDYGVVPSPGIGAGEEA